jgi:hypothetical protein
MVDIKMSEYMNKSAEMNGLGVNDVVPRCIARMPFPSCKQLQGFDIQNTGRGVLTFSLKKRGVVSTIPAEVITTLRVAASDRFRGIFENRRIVPQTVVIVDTNAVVPQRVEDTNGDGVLWQTNGPVGPTYPMKVGTVNYNEGKIDFTFYNAVTLPVSSGYKHSDWSDFTTPIGFDVSSGGARRSVIVYPDGAENYIDGIKDQEEIGFFAQKKTSGDPSTTMNLCVSYFGDDSHVGTVLVKGEITGYPYHNN